MSRRSRSRMRFATGLGGLIALLWGCQYLLDPQRHDENVAPEQKTNFSSSVKIYVKSATNANVYFGEFDRESCENGFPQQWSIFMTSVLGQHRFDIDYSNLVHKKKNEVDIKVHPQRYTLKYDRIPPNLATALLCERTAESSVTFAREATAAREILQPLQLLAPDCTFDWTEDKGLVCQLQRPTEAEVDASLETIKKNMTTKWNHQPYLLIRRMTLTSQLLGAFQKPENRSELDKVCRIMRFSLPNELPLSFRSKLWQDKVCQGKERGDRDAALMALQEAAQEIQALSRRIEDASLVGLFTLSIPRAQSMAKGYLITLQPIEAPYISSADQPNQSLPCVWHPLFSEQTESQLIAMDLEMVDNKGFSTCAASPGLVNAYRDANIYVRSSVASEMEFQIANGQSKRLRLPTGEYQYSVIQYNGPFPEELVSPEEVAPVSSGQISWKTARPHLIIKSW
ncbi:hypothetical protein [Oligoflexus tunisiensis]|uniref:hypothetical protein n=1 Tax=Oligoflexus tunisiensis TaxID=708132 RepID=UPI00114C95BE|nr:hypothetical protein [Oligoflexus tunisiensis]